MEQKSLVRNFRECSYKIQFARLSFSEIPENYVSFACGNFVIFKPEVLVKSSCFDIEHAHLWACAVLPYFLKASQGTFSSFWLLYKSSVYIYSYSNYSQCSIATSHHSPFVARILLTDVFIFHLSLSSDFHQSTMKNQLVQLVNIFQYPTDQYESDSSIAIEECRGIWVLGSKGRFLGLCNTTRFSGWVYFNMQLNLPY